MTDAAPALHLAVQYVPPLRVEELPARDRIRRWAKAAVAAGLEGEARDCVFTVRFVGAKEGRALNRDHRGRDYATNVLTFNLHDPDDDSAPVEADIVVCVPVVAREASGQRKSFEHHCAHMVIHAVLHACGYEHEEDDEADAMEALETRILRRFRIADPYQPVEPLLKPKKARKAADAATSDTPAGTAPEPAAKKRAAKKKAAEAA
ncbi:rRNA maturation RNase YbeY [Derxia gummosa]|uniref:Endoribonuclease YbeY n=1 Tax=Derxia gummosa DSM 723 TaxID=1121388 RepID=A0A8B6X9P1_9BURK|nr:rRNA maturation RNase YbeY [Derxia gummosa]